MSRSANPSATADAVAVADKNYPVGLIVPSSNTTMEAEISAMLRAREAGIDAARLDVLNS